MEREMIFFKAVPYGDSALKDSVERSQRVCGLLPEAEIEARLWLRAGADKAARLSGDVLEREGWAFAGVFGAGAPDVSGWGLSPSQALAAADALLSEGGLPAELRAAVLIRDGAGLDVPDGLVPAAQAADFIAGGASWEAAPRRMKASLGRYEAEIAFGPAGVESWELKEDGSPAAASEGSGLSSLGSYLASIRRMEGGRE